MTTQPLTKEDKIFTKHQVIVLLNRYGKHCAKYCLHHGYIDISGKDFLEAALKLIQSKQQ